MSGANGFQLEARTGGFLLRGRLDFDSAPLLWQERERLLAQGDSLDLDLSELEQANSAGLACLLNLHGAFLHAGKRLVLSQVPGQLRDMARVSGVDDILPFAENAAS
ncbi:MAG: STAS domain-containing protein [Gammaproteobacteria bacterium]|nr:STAS domain-containing protein [Gammaproteobacteria bacterium]